MKKVLVIYNPVSGAKKFGDTKKVVQNFLQKRNIDYVWFETIPADVQPLEDFLGQEYDRIIAIGGDGTVREVAHFIIENNINAPLAIIAGGSANVLATSLGIPTFPLQKALSFAIKYESTSIDVIYTNRRYYALIAVGQGYDSLFVSYATRGLKRRFGILAYLISFFRTFFASRNHVYSLVIDGNRHQVYAKSVIVFNMLTVGGVKIDKDISPSDGVLNILVLSPRSLWDVIKMGIMYLLRVSKRSIPKVRNFTGKKISINQKKGKHIQVDGEVFKGRNLQLEIKPGALNVVCK